MTKHEAAALVGKVMRDPDATTGDEAMNLMNAMWGLLTLAAKGEDIRPLLKQP